MSYFDPDLNKKVLIQDAEQVQQSIKKTREKREIKEKQEYDASVKEYERDVAAAEAQYQKDVSEYKKQQAVIEDRKAIEDKFSKEYNLFLEGKQQALAQARESVYGPGGSQNRSEYNSLANQIEKDYKSHLGKISREQQSALNIYDYSQAYPNRPLSGSVRGAFLSSGGQADLIGLQQKHDIASEARAAYKREASVQTAQAIARKQSIEYHSNIPNMGFITGYGLEEGSQRAGAIKSTPDAHPSLLGGGKKAVKTRSRMTNVDTGQSIMGGQQASPEITIMRTETYKETPDGPVLVRNVERVIPEKKESKGVPTKANPLAFIASLDRQDVDAAGVSTKPVQKEQQSPIFSFENVSEVKDPSAVALLEFQSQLKTRTAPSATVYKGILEEKGLKETPLAKRIIAEYASKPVKEYKTRAEAFGLPEAKGKLWTVTDPTTGESFDTQTLKGDRKIAQILGYQYSDITPKGQTLEGPWSFGFPKNYYIIPDSFGNPRKDYSGNIIYLESEESALKLSERFANKPSTLSVQTPDGPLLITSTPEKQKPLSSSGQRLELILNKIEEEQKKYAKYDDDVGKLLHYGLEGAKDIVGLGAYGENLLLQSESVLPKIKAGTFIETVPAKQSRTYRDIKIPEILSFKLSDDILQGRPQNISSTIKEYEKKYGEGAAGGAFAVNVVGLPVEGTGKLILRSSRLFAKQGTKIEKQIAVSTGKGSRSVQWDAAEKSVPSVIGKQGGIPIPTIGKKIEKQLEPNPFGKERVIPYNLQKAQQRIVGGLQTTKAKAVQVGGKVKNAIKKDFAFPNRSIIEGRNVEIPNLTRPAKPEFSKTLESLRIGFEVKKSAFAKRLSEMDKIYRGSIDQPVSPYNRRLESLGIGLRIKRQEFAKGISNIGKNIPELKTPKGIIKFKKQVKFIAKRTSKGIEKRRENLAKNLSKLKPTIKAPYLPQKTSLEIAKFKQKEKLDATLARMRKVVVAEEKPKVVVDIPSKNYLDNIKRTWGTENLKRKNILSITAREFKNIKSIVKPFQRPSLRKEFATGIRGSPIGKIKGTTSRKEFAKSLQGEINLPKTKLGKFPFRSKLSDPLYSKYDINRQEMLKDIYNLSNKGRKIFISKQKTFDLIKGQFISPDTKSNILKENLQSFMKKPRAIARLRSETMGLSKRGKLVITGVTIKGRKILYSFGLKAPAFPPSKDKELARVISNIGAITKEKNLFVSTQKAERFSAPFTIAGFGGKQKTVKDLIGEGKALEIRKQSNIKDLFEKAKKGQFVLSKAVIKKKSGVIIETGVKVNLPRQIKPIFKIPKSEITKDPLGQFGVKPIKETEVEKMVRLAKESKPKNQFYKKVRIDKYIPKYPKEWEKWRGVGIVTAAGTITALGLGQERAEALPLVQIGKIAGRTVESGGQILIYPEIKGGGKPFGSLGKTQKTPSLLVPPTLKETQREDDEELTLFARPKTRQVMTVLPKVSFEFSTPQRVQEAVRTKTIQPAKITVVQTPKQTARTRQREKARTIQMPKYEITPIQRITPKQKQVQRLATPLAPKAPTKLRAPQRQPVREKPKQIVRLITRPPRKPPRVIFALPPDREPEKKKGKKEPKDVIGFYLGNVPTSQIEGMFGRRREITLGKEKITRTLRGDARVLLGKSRTQKRTKKQEDMFGFKKDKTKFF